MRAYPAVVVAAVLARPDDPAADVAVYVSDQTLAIRRPIQAALVRKLWSEAGVLARAWVVANDPTQPFAQRWHCRAAYDAIEGGAFADFSPDDPANLARMEVYFGRLMAAGPVDDRVLTPGLVTATLALADATATVAEIMGRALDESDVLNIRAEAG